MVNSDLLLWGRFFMTFCLNGYDLELTNLSEDDLSKGNHYSKEMVDLANSEGAEIVKVSAQVESELIELGE